MQSVLKCCGPALCRASSATASCTLDDLPTAIAGSGDRLRLSGPIAIGSTAAEVFLLEYAQGLPEREVAWGRAATPAALRPLLKLHTLQFDLMQRTPYLAARQGSALVHWVVAAMRRSIETGAEADPPAGRKLTLLVGHDTNLANIGGMLGLHWTLPSYLPDETPPAGALHFELLRERPTGAYAVRVAYIAQTLDQMRQGTRLDRAHPPEQATVAIVGAARARPARGPRSRRSPWQSHRPRLHRRAIAADGRRPARQGPQIYAFTSLIWMVGCVLV